MALTTSRFRRGRPGDMATGETWRLPPTLVLGMSACLFDSLAKKQYRRFRRKKEVEARLDPPQGRGYTMARLLKPACRSAGAEARFRRGQAAAG
jgi:hypothetical protein